MVKSGKKIGQMLLEEGVISPGQLEEGLRQQEKNGDFLCATLAGLGYAPEEEIFGVLSRQLRIPYVRIGSRELEPAIIRRVPAQFVSHYRVVPLDFHEGTLSLAMADPLDSRMLDDLRLLLGVEVRGVLASTHEIVAAIRKYYGVGADTIEKMITRESPLPASAPQMEEMQDLQALAEDASIVTFVNQILSEAIKERATDIHLEPYPDELRTRFRIDGVMYKINTPQNIRNFHPAIVSRIKIMSQLNIAERRLPQDGRMRVKMAGDELDLRISIVPSAFGEAVHIRILGSRLFLELEKLGFQPDDLERIAAMIKKPHGVIFVTGPTGSGKTTTLYASLAKINSDEIKIITIEDPIEYQLKGVTQIQVAPKIGLSFAAGLRHMLRHDPDVMMVGEVRDYETAEIAIRAALTGHLVFSTLHTNDAAGAVTRLLDMGVEPFLVSSSLECLIAQRLVRRICERCKAPAPITPEQGLQLREAGVLLSGATLYAGTGCQECRSTGYRGRTGIYEMLMITPAIRELVLKRASSQQIREQAVRDGMRSLRRDALSKAVAGITTFAEVVRVTQLENLP